MTTVENQNKMKEHEVVEILLPASTNDNNESCDWSLKSKEERTPRKFRSKEPDVIVIVGGVEFYHYEDVLCSNCDYFDSVLASHMKESQTGIIEFPVDRDPAEWLQVYKFLDPMNYIGLQQYTSSMITNDNVDVLLSWFDYLNMEQHLEQCDNVLSNRINNCSCQTTSITMTTNMISWTSTTNMISYVSWEQLKGFTCSRLPQTKQAIMAATKRSAPEIIKNITSENTKEQESYDDLKSFLLDEECGDELWDYFIGSVVELPKEMLEELDRETILSSPTFKYMAGKCLKPPPPTPKKKKSFFDSSSEEDSSEDEPVRHRAPAPAPAPRPAARRIVDSDSDSGDSDSS